MPWSPGLKQAGSDHSPHRPCKAIRGCWRHYPVEVDNYPRWRYGAHLGARNEPRTYSSTMSAWWTPLQMEACSTFQMLGTNLARKYRDWFLVATLIGMWMGGARESPSTIQNQDSIACRHNGHARAIRGRWRVKRLKTDNCPTSQLKRVTQAIFDLYQVVRYILHIYRVENWYKSRHVCAWHVPCPCIWGWGKGQAITPTLYAPPKMAGKLYIKQLTFINNKNQKNSHKNGKIST